MFVLRKHINWSSEGLNNNIIMSGERERELSENDQQRDKYQVRQYQLMN